MTHILSNIHTDSLDFEFNIAAYAPATQSSSWVFHRRYNLDAVHQDSAGKHRSMYVMAQTIFMDNQKENRTLQYSGRIAYPESNSHQSTPNGNAYNS
ncbi:hypothetical protein N9C70_03525 [Flavobacteriales bacterium]|nr:hypothetical protein [Flavobacteriales bacterium]